MILRPKRFAFLILLFAGSFFQEACNESSHKGPDISGIHVDVQFKRFDKDLYALDTAQIEKGLTELHKKYPDFLDYFLDTLMAYGINGNYADTTKGVREGLKVFLTYKDFRGLEDTILHYYPDTKETDKALTNGFTYLKYYFPDATIPSVIYLNMGLSNWAAFQPDERTMCIGLDMFLGEQYPYYRSFGVPAYMGAHLRTDYIPVSVFRALYKTGHPFILEDRVLLDLMLQRGREFYYVHSLLPDAPESLLFGYSQAQMEWCNEHEGLIYNFFIQQNLLYNKERLATQPFVFEGPSTPGIPASGKIQETPGNIGSWLGYRIVSAYMQKHADKTLKQLVEMPIDGAKMLDEAKYRPK